MTPTTRVALITGASSGIGEALARELAATGWAVGLTARRCDRLASIANEIRSSGGTVAVVPADVRDRLALRQAVVRLEADLGPTDLLIANAGLGTRPPLTASAGDDLVAMIEVNLLGAACAIDAVLPGMLERGRGQLVGISSLAAYRGLPGSAGYCASKAGLSTLLESLRVDLAPRGIAVTTVHPGYVATAMTAGANHPKPFELDARSAARVILRGVAARRREVNFPWTMAAVLGLIRRLPNPVYDRLARRLAPPETPTPSAVGASSPGS